MAEIAGKWANMEVLLLTTLLERHFPLDDKKQFGTLRLVKLKIQNKTTDKASK